MENKKDIESSYNGQDTKNKLILSLFEKDNYLLFIYKKSERIVSAFYLVSNLFSENEPLKWQIRNIGLSIISQVLSLSSIQADKSGALHLLAVDLVKLLSLLDVSFVAGVVSEMNYKLLKRELEHLLQTLSDNGFNSEVVPEKNVAIGEAYFSIPTVQLTKNSSDILQRPNQLKYPGEVLETANQTVQEWGDVQKNQLRAYKGQINAKKILKDSTMSSETPVSIKSDAVETSGTQREVLIVDLLKTKNNLTVKDFTSVIKGFSDKTIQRELLRLVSVGVLKKVGERRWSRYSLSD